MGRRRPFSSKISIVLLQILLSAGVTPAQTPNSVRLESIRQMRKGVDAWPLVAHPSTPAEQGINAILNGLNERLAKALKECDENYRAWATLVDQPLTGKNAAEHDWERKITVTMTGPHFLSIVASDNFIFCGGAHPDSDTLAMVFDLSTGRRVNWMSLIAKSSNATTYSDADSDETTVGALTIPALSAMSLAHADEECKDVFQKPRSYQLWPDAKSGTLIAEPSDLPHVVAACAEDLKLNPDQARKLGFDGMLLNAITQAHKQSAAKSR